jgi:hypothetical protein
VQRIAVAAHDIVGLLITPVEVPIVVSLSVVTNAPVRSVAEKYGASDGGSTACV